MERKEGNNYNEGIVVLSLCDGMSCGQMALDEVGIKVKKYFAAEIKEIAVNATKQNFPNTIHIGDVTKITYRGGILYTEDENYKTSIDLVIFGSPCQSFSRAMKTEGRIGLDDMQRSGLFLECHRILNEVKPKYFLMENVIMKNEDRDVISKMIGVEPIRINSSLVTGQLRDRYYWTNIPNITVPVDKHIEFSELLNDGYTPHHKAKCLMANDSHGYYNGCGWTPIKRFYRWYFKSFTNMVFPSKDDFDKCLEIAKEILNGEKPSAKVFEGYKGHDFDCARYLWKEERAKLQTVPEKYVEFLTEKEAADLLGDGWTVEVIAHIFKNMQF